MKHLFVPYEIAVIAKEKGFDEPCLGYYTPTKQWMNQGNKFNPNPHFHGPNWSANNDKFYFKYVKNSFGDRDANVKNSCFTNAKQNISVPIYQQLIDWFREKYKLHIEVIYRHSNSTNKYEGWLQKEANDIPCQLSDGTYYEALNKALEEAFKLINIEEVK